MNNKDLQNTIGKNIIHLTEIDSTNNYAMQLLHDGKTQHGTVVVTNCQTKGKGQRGKAWYTGSGNNIACTVVVEPSFLQIHEMFYLHCYVCVSVVEFLSSYKQGFCIKWPNDIFFNHKKMGGILIENKLQGKNWKHAIIGIGLNINEDNIQNTILTATSLQQITQKQHDVIELALQLIAQLNSNWPKFADQKEIFYRKYLDLLYKKGELVQLKEGTKRFETLLQTVDTGGQLVCGENHELMFNFGDIEWVIG